MSDDLLSFSKKHNVELRARPASDADVSLSVVDLAGLGQSVEESQWSLTWALRYSVTAKHQHLLLSKGYLYACSHVESIIRESPVAISQTSAILSH